MQNRKCGAQHLAFSILFQPGFQFLTHPGNNSANQCVPHQEGSLAVIYARQLCMVGGEHIQAFQLHWNQSTQATGLVLDDVPAAVRTLTALRCDDGPRRLVNRIRTPDL